MEGGLSMTVAPVIHGSLFLPWFEFLSRIGAPIERLLEREHVPPSILEDHDRYVSADRAFRFAVAASVTEGIPHIGWATANKHDLIGVGGCMDRVRRTKTLRRAIESLIHWYPIDAPVTRIDLVEGRETAWLLRRQLTRLKSNPGRVVVEDFTVARLVNVVRLAAGPNWLPSRLKLQTWRTGDDVLPPALRDVQIEFGKPYLAIGIPTALLDAPIISPLESRLPKVANIHPRPPSLAEYVTDELRPLIGLEDITVELAADVVGLHARSLSRHLEAEGKGWRGIRRDLLHEASKHYLEDPELPIHEIASRLGFSDAPHFTRAFKSWQGDSPSDFRRGARSRSLE
jgi:AraC-like DNA-binding protein